VHRNAIELFFFPLVLRCFTIFTMVDSKYFKCCRIFFVFSLTLSTVFFICCVSFIFQF